MLRGVLLTGLALILLVPSVLAGPQRWLHVAVDEEHRNGDRVRVNLPLDLVEAVLPLIDAEDFHRGRVQIQDHDFTEIDFPAIIRALRGAEDGEYVTVEGRYETVRVAKSGDFLLVRAEEPGEEVNVRISLTVADALFSGDLDELDVLAAVQALDDEEECELVRVIGEDETVRIWIDRHSSSD